MPVLKTIVQGMRKLIVAARNDIVFLDKESEGVLTHIRPSLVILAELIINMVIEATRIDKLVPECVRIHFLPLSKKEMSCLRV